jgi:quercetin dioxygenase-like cupin family protein
MDFLVDVSCRRVHKREFNFWGTVFSQGKMKKDKKGDSKHVLNGAGNSELEKSKIHIIVEIIEYVPNAVVSKTIIKKTTGNVTVSSFDAGEELAEKTSPFDNYIQIIDGAAEVIISGKKFKLKLGEGIVIPAHASHEFCATEQFKMISTIIKSGYED